MNEERRTGGQAKRIASAMVYRNGEPQESKIWATVGKALCALSILLYGELLIANPWSFFIALAILVFPDVAKKAITMRFNAMPKIEEPKT